jgi:hypothetical protein
VANRIVRSVVAIALSAGLLGASQVACAQAAPVDSAAPTLQSGCVEALSWWSSNGIRYVRVKNHCSGTRCYKVDQPYIGDTLNSVASYATEDDNYSSTWFAQGRGVYDASC